MGEFPYRFDARLESSRRALWFAATVEYSFTVVANLAVPPLHPHAVARSLLRRQAQRVSREFLPGDVEAAQDAINAYLSDKLEADPRIAVTARVRLSLEPDIAEEVERQKLAERQRSMEEHLESVRLNILRERLVDEALGLPWWIDRYADLMFMAGDPKVKAEAVITAFRSVQTALRHEHRELIADEKDVVLARVDELLRVLEDPTTAVRAAGVLEQLVHAIHGNTRPAGISAQAREADNRSPHID
nr:hypothetical protein KitaXyl93_39060 [Kitasatospora sp. Xyl93]